LKDYLRDYATAAFRFYARLGRPSHDEIKRAIYNEALASSKRELNRINGVCNPTRQAIINAEAAVDQMAGELGDVLAVERALATMRPEWIAAVEIVYFADAHCEFERGDILAKIHKAALSIPASERQIFRWLGRARMMFAAERGLRLPDSSRDLLHTKHSLENVPRKQ